MAREKSFLQEKKRAVFWNPGLLGEKREQYLCAMQPPSDQEKLVTLLFVLFNAW